MDEHACDCPAKVNLSLAILGYDPDARMHAVDTVIAKISLADTVSLQITQGHGVSVEFSIELVSGLQANVNPKENSLTRAYYELDTLAGGELPGMLVRVIKRIPIGSGLGGGSSDAAGFLKMIRGLAARNTSQKGSLDRISQLSENDWLELASHIGADVPAFMLQGPVRARGFGEKVEAVALEGLSEFRCVLSIPEVSFSTASMYAKVGSYSSFSHAEEFLREWSTDGPKAAFRIARNDFTPIARDTCADVSAALDRLAAEGYLMTEVSGSGSAVFGILHRDERKEGKAALYDFLV